MLCCNAVRNQTVPNRCHIKPTGPSPFLKCFVAIQRQNESHHRYNESLPLLIGAVACEPAAQRLPFFVLHYIVFHSIVLGSAWPCVHVGLATQKKFHTLKELLLCNGALKCVRTFFNYFFDLYASRNAEFTLPNTPQKSSLRMESISHGRKLSLEPPLEMFWLHHIVMCHFSLHWHLWKHCVVAGRLEPLGRPSGQRFTPILLSQLHFMLAVNCTFVNHFAFDDKEVFLRPLLVTPEVRDLHKCHRLDTLCFLWTVHGWRLFITLL